MKRYFTIAFLCSLLFAVSISAQGIAEGFSQYQLQNGLTVYLWEDHDQPLVHGWTITRAGSIDEPQDATGLAHYLEHMLFKGTESIGALDWEKEKPYYERVIALYDTLALTSDAKQREAIQLRINEASRSAAQYSATDEFSNLIQAIGGEDLNAYTNYDQTCYMNTFPAYQMERWLTVYSDRLINPVFRTFQAELENVFEEYNMYLDDNSTHVNNFISGHIFQGHAYARDIIGYPEDLKNPKLRHLINFYNTWYVPNNMALVLVGDFNSEEIKPLIEKTFGRLQYRELPARQTYPATLFDREERFSAKLGYMPEYFRVYEGVPAGHPDELLLDFTLELLSNDMGIGLFDRLAINSKVMGAAAMNDCRRDLGRIMLLGVPYMDPDSRTYNSLPSTEKLLMSEVDSLIAGNYSDELIEAVRQSLCQQYDRAMEYPQMKVHVIEQSFIYQIPMEQMLREKERVLAVTRDDIQRIAKQYLTTPCKIFEIAEGTPKKDKIAKPKIKPIDSPKGQSAYYKSFLDIPAGKLVPKFVDLSDIDKDRFYEGVDVYCTPNPRNGIFSLRLKYGVGKYNMPLLEYAASMMNVAGVKGAPGKSANQFRSELAKLGAKCTYSATDNYFIVNVEGNEANLPEIVSLVNLQLLFPDFSSENDAKLNNIKGQEYSSRQIEQRNTDIVADAAYDYVLYGENSSYLRRPSLKEILDLTPARLEGVLHNALNYQMEIHYVGAMPADSVKTILYGHLPMSENAIVSLSPIERPRVKQSDKNQRIGGGNPVNAVYFLADREMQQAKIYLYIDGEPYDTKDAVKYMAFNEYFGGGFSGLVMNEIREKRSMAYTAVGFFRRPPVQKQGTYFMGYVGTQSDKVSDAVDVYMSLLDSMPRNSENFENIRTILRQSLLSNKPTFRTKSQRMTDWFRLGYKIDPSILQIRQVQKLSFDDVDAFYRNHIEGHAVTILIMGDPKLINQKQLKTKYGKITKLNKASLFSRDEL